MSKITELQEKRARIWKQAKDFLDTKQKESDVLSAEDNATYEKMNKTSSTWVRKSIGSINKMKLKLNSISPQLKPLLIPRLLENYQRVRMLMRRTFGK